MQQAIQMLQHNWPTIVVIAVVILIAWLIVADFLRQRRKDEEFYKLTGIWPHPHNKDEQRQALKVLIDAANAEIKSNQKLIDDWKKQIDKTEVVISAKKKEKNHYLGIAQERKLSLSEAQPVEA